MLNHEVTRAIIIAVISSGGFWTLVMMFIQNYQRKKSGRSANTTNQAAMLRGLAHDRLVYLCKSYINRGWIGAEEYENLVRYLYEPYRALGGNGTVEKLMEDVKELPIHEITTKEAHHE